MQLALGVSSVRALFAGVTLPLVREVLRERVVDRRLDGATTRHWASEGGGCAVGAPLQTRRSGWSDCLGKRRP